MPNGSPIVTQCLDEIRRGIYAPQITTLRAAETQEQRRELKKKLPAVTWAGKFSRRNKKNITAYSGLICLDIDHVGTDKLQAIREGLSHNPYVLSFFVSPSGNGLKILFRAPDLDPALHEQRFTALSASIARSYGVEYDPTGKDICRLCFLSFDPDLYYNEAAEPVPQSLLDEWAAAQQPAQPAKSRATTASPEKKPRFDAVAKCHEMVQKQVQAGPGSHNRYANQFCLFANRFGIAEADCLAELSDYLSDYDRQELAAVVENVYSRMAAEAGKWATATPRPFSGQPGEVAAFNDTVKFWYACPKYTKDGSVQKDRDGNDVIEYRYSYDDAISFLQNNGFYKLRGEGNTYQLIRIEAVRKVVDVVIERQAKEYMLDYLKSDPGLEFKQVREMFRRGAKNYTSTSMLEGLDYAAPTLRKDTKTTGYLYFQNCFLEVTAEAITRHDYARQEDFIWAKQIKPHNYTDTDGSACDFARFLMYAIGGEKREFGAYGEKAQQKILATFSSIGYLIHRHKDAILTKAIIATDMALRHGTENEGRSGKSLLGKALEQMMICTVIDGRNFSFDKDFAFQKVNIDTQLINFNDIKPKFDFTRLFGMITEEFTFEKKGKDVITIPFEDAPKFYISSNSTLRGEGSSTRARQQIIEFTNYFNEQHTPVIEFGRRFFHGGWDEAEWCRFFHFMALCQQLYFQRGLIDFPLENYALNTLLETPGCGEEGLEFFNEAILENVMRGARRFDSGLLFTKYKEKLTAAGIKHDWLKKNSFTKWAKTWAGIQDMAINAHKKDGRDKSDGVDWWTFAPLHDQQQAGADAPISETETELPF